MILPLHSTDGVPKSTSSDFSVAACTENLNFQGNTNRSGAVTSETASVEKVKYDDSAW
jgi:hypothetical protein